jgi:hypothetical protein
MASPFRRSYQAASKVIQRIKHTDTNTNACAGGRRKSPLSDTETPSTIPDFESGFGGLSGPEAASDTGGASCHSSNWMSRNLKLLKPKRGLYHDIPPLSSKVSHQHSNSYLSSDGKRYQKVGITDLDQVQFLPSEAQPVYFNYSQHQSEDDY